MFICPDCGSDAEYGDRACPECGGSLQSDPVPTSGPSPDGKSRRRRRIGVAVVVGLAALLAIGAMEIRHRSVREIESLAGGKHRGVFISWRWTVDSDPLLYNPWVRLEYWLYDHGDIASFLGTNLERIRRRMRSNFSLIDKVSVRDRNLLMLTDDDEYRVVRRAVEIARARGARSLRWYDYEWSSSKTATRISVLDRVAKQSDETGRRARDLLDLAKGMTVR